MTYRDHSHAFAHDQHRPPRLIDLIPDNRYELDVSDEEDDFYGRDEDFLIPVKWQTAIAKTTDRIPRRIKRYSYTYLAVAILGLISWWTYFGPRRAAYNELVYDMDHEPAMPYGSNVRPEFKDMIQVRDMDQEHLPEKHKNKRLIFVGDVHGCRAELEHLLYKVAFNHKHDHLILTGDMIAKGPDSAGVIKLAAKLGASCVRGNWEDKFLLSLSSTSTSSSPTSPELTRHKSSRELRHLAHTIHAPEIAFLQQCPVILRVGPIPCAGSFVAVHAGLVPDTPLEHQDPYHVMNMRSIDLKTRIPSSRHDGTPWEQFWNHRQKKLKRKDRVKVVYGHNRKKGLNVRKYSFGLDTGCVDGGRLTALVVDGRGETELVHVKCHRNKGYQEAEGVEEE